MNFGLWIFQYVASLWPTFSLDTLSNFKESPWRSCSKRGKEMGGVSTKVGHKFATQWKSINQKLKMSNYYENIHTHILNLYGEDCVNKTKIFEKLRYKLKKRMGGLTFPKMCLDSFILPSLVHSIINFTSLPSTSWAAYVWWFPKNGWSVH